jgi:anthranilate synthase component 1
MMGREWRIEPEVYQPNQSLMSIQPSAEDFKRLVGQEQEAAKGESTLPPNLYPVYAFELAESLTPHVAYLKLAKPASKDPQPSFLLESAIGGERVDRYSFIGVNPRKTIKTGNGFGPDVDPLTVLEEELAQYRQSKNNIGAIPRLSGGAVGYVSFDCIKYFEPKTARDLKDPLGIPEAALMLFDTIVAFDNVYQRIQVIHNIYIPDNGESIDLEQEHKKAQKIISDIFDTLKNGEAVPPPQPPVAVNDEYVSNIGQTGYENHVKKLKEHILKGDIFQAVPSQRVSHKTKVHPFNIYRHLRTVNPSPYLFYLDFIDFQVVGASPELLAKSEKGRIITHPIAGTLKRGKTIEEDDKLAADLLASTKDRAEHVMLVDLARNDINRVCDPQSTSVDRLLTVERFSHVMHLVSQVSGVLREDKTRFDAFRSIFPAGTVSGAPKVRAMQLISELEGERRGIYAGAVGHWGYDDRQMDTCIALRTMFVKDETVYLQAGGGIVHDSDPYDEYIETVNKMNSNIVTIKQCEELWAGKTADK